MASSSSAVQRLAGIAFTRAGTLRDAGPHGLTLVLFHRPDCGWCTAYWDTFQRLGETLGFCTLAAFDTSTARNVGAVRRLRAAHPRLLRGTPTVVAFRRDGEGSREGHPVEKATGDRAFDAIVAMAMRCAPPVPPRRRARAAP